MESVERYEQKFLISPRVAEQIEHSLAPLMSRDRASQTGPYRVMSLYLDGPFRPLYEATRGGASKRLKLRIRTYDGENAFLEVKRKIRGMVWKSRVMLTKQQYVTLLSRSSRREELRSIKSSLKPTERETLDEFYFWRDRYQASPAMWIGYQRLGFESTVDHYARVTFDFGVKAKPCVDYSITKDVIDRYENQWRQVDMASHFRSGHADIILELKSERMVPSWMTDLCQRFNLRACGVSKYCLGVERFDVRSEYYRFGQLLGAVGKGI